MESIEMAVNVTFGSLKESLKKILPIGKGPITVLGIDIGNSTIRVVELAKHGEQEMLKNYAVVPLLPAYERPIKKIKQNRALLSSTEIAEILNSILKEAEIKTKRAVFSIPDLATFFTSFVLPPMSKEEMPQAVRFEARRHVPLPLSEITLDWLVTKGRVSDHKTSDLEILLVAVPNTTIDQYTKIAELCGLELISLEAEVFGLFRALVKDNHAAVGLIEIGGQSTTCSVVDGKTIKLSHSFDIAGNSLTQRLSKSLNLEYKQAENLKKIQGIFKGVQNTRNILTPLLDLILVEIDKVVQSFYRQEGKEIETYILAGDSALLPGLKQYFSKSLGKEVNIAQPFVDMVYPPILEEIVKEIGPGFSVAAGMALKELE